MPYLLARKITKIDYLIISHFDEDHIGGLFDAMNNIKVGKVLISKQLKTNENYEVFKQIVKANNIKVQAVEKGDTLSVEKNIHLDFLWPNNSKLISNNFSNNNSLVFKLYYKNFSCIFTGDIESKAEQEILQEYKNNKKELESTILKVAHHGSSTSTTWEFLECVNPKIALIGVGKNNKFGHPENEVINRLENIRSKSI